VEEEEKKKGLEDEERGREESRGGEESMGGEKKK
jgi:hypothetical protein